MKKHTWAKDLQPVGAYYEGVVDDRLIAETVTTIGTI